MEREHGRLTEGVRELVIDGTVREEMLGDSAPTRLLGPGRPELGPALGVTSITLPRVCERVRITDIVSVIRNVEVSAKYC